MSKKLLCTLLACLLLLPVLLLSVGAEPETVPLFAANNSAVAYCIDTEQILYEIRRKRYTPPASPPS